MATRASSFVYSVLCEICVCGCVMCLPMWPPAGAGRGSLLCRITNGGEEIFDEEDVRDSQINRLSSLMLAHGVCAPEAAYVNAGLCFIL
jgi:hypothetical protein